MSAQQRKQSPRYAHTGKSAAQSVAPEWRTDLYEYFTEAEVEANARLIAAAPDLLAICIELRAVLGNAEWGTEAHGSAILAETIDAYEPKLRAAIAKATAAPTPLSEVAASVSTREQL